MGCLSRYSHSCVCRSTEPVKVKLSKMNVLVSPFRRTRPISVSSLVVGLIALAVNGFAVVNVGNVVACSSRLFQNIEVAA